jgi:N6-adenosine-specific RNA methylase IME4
VSNNKLVVLRDLERGLAQIASVGEAREHDRQLAALETYARGRHLDIPTQNRIVLARALVQRRGGELVEAIPRSKGGRGKKGGKAHLVGAALGIQPRGGYVSRWVSLVAVEESELRAVVARRSERNQTVTLGYLYGLARPAPGPITTPGFPAGPFRTLVIDPPWPIEKIALERRLKERSQRDYAAQELTEIAELPIPELADPRGAHVYLWVTHRFLPFGLKLFEKWDVRYECVLTWFKPTAQPLWWTYNTEHILFGKVASLAPLVKGTPVGFTAPQQRHSHKPDEFFETVRRVSPEPRLTMYDDERQGFARWGVVHARAI